MSRRTGWVWAWLATLPLAAQAQIDLAALDRDMAGPRAKVMDLGTVHLNAMPPGFDLASLQGLLDRLAASRPDIIAVEALPGEECDMAARHAAKDGTDYCAPTHLAKAATGLDTPATIAEVDKTLQAWPAQSRHGQRHRLATLFLTANDRASAYVQWLQLLEGGRRKISRQTARLAGRGASVAGQRQRHAPLRRRRCIAGEVPCGPPARWDPGAGDAVRVAARAERSRRAGAALVLEALAGASGIVRLAGRGDGSSTARRFALRVASEDQA
jgi:hypothetical protein